MRSAWRTRSGSTRAGAGSTCSSSTASLARSADRAYSTASATTSARSQAARRGSTCRAKRRRFPVIRERFWRPLSTWAARSSWADPRSSSTRWLAKSSRLPRGFRISWAMPAAICPMATSRRFRSSCSSRRRNRVTSWNTTTQPPRFSGPPRSGDTRSPRSTRSPSGRTRVRVGRALPWRASRSAASGSSNRNTSPKGRPAVSGPNPVISWAARLMVAMRPSASTATTPLGTLSRRCSRYRARCSVSARDRPSSRSLASSRARSSRTSSWRRA